MTEREREGEGKREGMPHLCRGIEGPERGILQSRRQEFSFGGYITQEFFMGPVGSRGRPRKLEHFADIVL